MVKTEKIHIKDLSFFPLTIDRWADFEELFGVHGAYAGCWCMWWRTTRKQFEQQGGEGNRLAMKAIVESGRVPGILAYHCNQVMGWCSVAPRDHYSSLNRSHVLKRLDDNPVWSIVCFYIAKTFRGSGMTGHLVKGAVNYARQCGATIIEAYPTRPRGKKLAPVSSFMGLPRVFEKNGFITCKRPSDAKVIMRYTV